MANDPVIQHQALSGGVVRAVEDATSTFEGTTPAGVIAMRRRFDLEQVRVPADNASPVQRAVADEAAGPSLY